MKKILCIAFLLLSGCATSPHQFNTDELAPKPGDRVLSAIVMYDSGFSRAQCQEAIALASQHLQGYHGISIQPVEWVSYSWHHTDINHLLGEEWRQVDGRKDFDIVIGFYSQSLANSILGEFAGGWKAVTDDTYRRYIVLKSDDWYDLAHEVTHGFMLSHTHDFWGMMAAAQHGIPFVKLYLRSAHVSEDLRAEVSANKWRDFSLEVNLGKDRPEVN